jgi:hypothetical protein
MQGSRDKPPRTFAACARSLSGLTGFDSKPRRCVSMPSYPDVARKSMQGTTTGEYNYALAA